MWATNGQFDILPVNIRLKRGACPNKQVPVPETVFPVAADHKVIATLLRKLRALPGIRRFLSAPVFVLIICWQIRDKTFLKELCQKYHISGSQLKVAPEHVSDAVLDKMGKPHHEAYVDFTKTV